MRSREQTRQGLPNDRSVDGSPFMASRLDEAIKFGGGEQLQDIFFLMFIVILRMHDVDI